MLPSMIRRGRLPKSELKRKALSLLDSVGLSERAHHRPTELSGGEQQRVAVARALINEPKLLLCDEPTGNLDSENSNRLMQLLKRLNSRNNQTFMIVTHDESSGYLADRVIKIKDGEFIK
jgi:ABC-type lipoprotein export system ATPase subunit